MKRSCYKWYQTDIYTTYIELSTMKLQPMLIMFIRNYPLYTSTIIYIYTLGKRYNNMNVLLKKLANAIFFYLDFLMDMLFY